MSLLKIAESAWHSVIFTHKLYHSYELSLISTAEYCSGEYFDATCPNNDVIVMRSARYGRMRTGRCISTDINIGCQADVITHMDQLCSGQQQCRHRIIDDDFADFNSCPGDLKGFLEASYTCQPGNSFQSPPSQNTQNKHSTNTTVLRLEKERVNGICLQLTTSARRRARRRYS